MSEEKDPSDSDSPIIDDNVIRIQLRKSSQGKWELRTRNLSPRIRFPTIQLFDCDGNLLIETNDENISIKSSDYNDHVLHSTQSMKEKGFRHFINKSSLKKHNTVAGDRIYTRLYRPFVRNNKESRKLGYLLRDSYSVTNIPTRLTVDNSTNLQVNSLSSTPFNSDCASEISSYKSSDDETDETKLQHNRKTSLTLNGNAMLNSFTSSSIISVNGTNQSVGEISPNKGSEVSSGVHKSKSFGANTLVNGNPDGYTSNTGALHRSKSGIQFRPPQNKVSFLNTYLKSLPVRTKSNPDWFTSKRQKTIESLGISSNEKRQTSFKISSGNGARCKSPRNITENEFINVSTDAAADCEMRKRLKMYRRGISEIGPRREPSELTNKRTHSVSDIFRVGNTSSSDSVDEADVVLNRLKRRILRNKFREKRRNLGAKFQFTTNKSCVEPDPSTSEWRDAVVKARGDAVDSPQSRSMGSNISQHSAKGLKGRRARSSGDLCNGDAKSQTELSVCGSVVGDAMGWNRSLPNHLDGNRHLADYSRVNNNYADFGTYNRCHPKGGRGLRYRVSKSGSDAEPVWKLQDPGFDQGYASERSPEEDNVPPIVPPVSLEEYEAELRTVYPFINDENTFTVVVEKDGRGLGMSVCGGGGLVRIRRLYPPQPAWRTGRLAPKDLLLAANNVPLAGLSTYEALEVLRTAPARVELRVCRAPPDVLESVTPPDPPTPPARTPHPPLDPLNCHPMHARLSQTTSSATTSSSEGRGRRDTSPEPDRRDLRLPDLDRPLPVYDVQYGEFDIVMTKVNGSLGFTLRKEDHSALGHYVRALVREPALSDGRIQPGDRIVAVNDTSMSNMSHAEAVAFLRACGSEVRLRLYRDHAATPLSPVSPKEEGPTDSDGPSNRPKPPLRAEAVSMLCDLAARRLTPDAVDGSRSPCLSPRKFRRLTKDNNHYEQPTDMPINTVEAQTVEIKKTANQEPKQSANENSARAQRANTIMLVSPTVPPARKQKLSLTVPPHGYELNNLDNDALDAPNLYQEEMSCTRYPPPVFSVNSNEPVSMPVELLPDEARFKHTNPAYQSAVLHTTNNDGNSDGHMDDHNMKKWKGVAALSPENERKVKAMPSPLPKTKDIHSIQKENVKPESPRPQPTRTITTEPTIVTVELNRGWNSRLGFSVQSHPDTAQSYISAVYDDSVAARDGRLRQGDVILQVNDENVTSMKTPEVIDLLRLLRGSICITVLRPPNPQ